MAKLTTHFKLGLFALVAIASLFATAFVLGLRGSRSETITYHTYFDESVQGLELGARVKYRGVRIGSIAAIEVAPDRQHIDVSLALLEAELRHLDLSNPELRTELGTQGVTGIKYVEIDLVAPGTHPAAALSFPPAARYIPARTSLLKRLEDSTGDLGRGTTELLRGAAATLHRVDGVLDDFREQRVAAHLANLLDRADEVVANVSKLVGHFDRANMPGKAIAAIDRVAELAVGLRKIADRIDGDAGLIAAARRVLDRIGGDDGLVASARRATDAIGDVGHGARGSTAELERTIRDLGEAARVFRDFVDELGRDPDMLVKGRGKAKGP